MKKTRFLTLVLAAAIMLMGAGYALWNEVIPLNATVNSTYLNIGLDSEVSTEYAFDSFDPIDYGTKCSIKLSDNERGKATNSSQADVFFKNLFPGVTQTAIVRFINDSKIPVQLQEVAYSDIIGCQNQDLLRDTTIEVYSMEKDNGMGYSLDILKGKTYKAGGNNDIIPSVVLQPGEYLTYKIVISLDVDSDNNSQLQDFGFSMIHTWQQQTDLVAP